MSHPLIRSTRFLSGILLLSFLPHPAIAHEVKVSGEVAATFHLEPNHNPKAGELTKIWFALTEKGGKIIPLKHCNCKLTIRSEPHVAGSNPLLEPSLKAISAEQYQGIPGTEIVFPKPGAYALELSGTAKAGASFQPFEFPYTVIVRAGTVAPKTSRTSAQSSTLDRPIPPWQILVALGAVGGIGAIAVRTNRSKR
jgi:hypothetical protein